MDTRPGVIGISGIPSFSRTLCRVLTVIFTGVLCIFYGLITETKSSLALDYSPYTSNGLTPTSGAHQQQDQSSALGSGTSPLKGHDIDQPIEIDADRSELNSQEGTVLFSGNVIVTQGEMTLKSAEITIYYLNEGTGDPQIIRIDALKDVILTSKGEIVTGKWGVYDAPKRLITLGGGVKLTRGDAAVEGELLQLNLVSGITTLDSATLSGTQEGRVKGRFLAPPLR